MATRLIHATHEGSHLYKFFMPLSDINRMRADGEPIDTGWLPQQNEYLHVDHFFKFDHEISEWTHVVRTGSGSFVRNEKESPFKIDLPPSFKDGEEMAEWACDHDLGTCDEDGYPRAGVLALFYVWVADEESETRPYDFEVRHIGEITPCPHVTFAWEPIQPHEVGVPSEMWHMGPVQVTRKSLLSMFWGWVERHKGDLLIENLYPSSQDGAVYFRAEGGPLRSICVLNDPEFSPLLKAVTGENLEDLEDKLDLLMTALQNLMCSFSPTHRCPKCEGAGALPCPRCGGAGTTDDGKMAAEALRVALSKVGMIRGSRGDKAEAEARAAVKALEKYFV